jgi:hypothetical protein
MKSERVGIVNIVTMRMGMLMCNCTPDRPCCLPHRPLHPKLD